MVETIYGCKWSLTIYQLLANDINRPGEMVRSIEGLTTKVLNQCLKKNTDFGILDRISYNEVPPKVEYKVTEFGQKFMTVLEELEKLQREIEKQV
jgi:DNA-binding HxlR family transcriptional regulator